MEYVGPRRLARIFWTRNNQLALFVRHVEGRKTLIELVEKSCAHAVVGK